MRRACEDRYHRGVAASTESPTSRRESNRADLDALLLDAIARRDDRRGPSCVDARAEALAEFDELAADIRINARTRSDLSRADLDDMLFKCKLVQDRLEEARSAKDKYRRDGVGRGRSLARERSLHSTAEYPAEVSSFASGRARSAPAESRARRAASRTSLPYFEEWMTGGPVGVEDVEMAGGKKRTRPTPARRAQLPSFSFLKAANKLASKRREKTATKHEGKKMALSLTRASRSNNERQPALPSVRDRRLLKRQGGRRPSEGKKSVLPSSPFSRRSRPRLRWGNKRKTSKAPAATSENECFGAGNPALSNSFGDTSAAAVMGPQDDELGDELLRIIERTGDDEERLRALTTLALQLATAEKASRGHDPLAEFDHFRVVLDDEVTDVVVRLPRHGPGRTFADLRREIEMEVLDDGLLFPPFRFVVDPLGNAAVRRRQEESWRARDHLGGPADAGDGSPQRPFVVHVVEDDVDVGEVECDCAARSPLCGSAVGLCDGGGYDLPEDRSHFAGPVM